MCRISGSARAGNLWLIAVFVICAFSCDASCISTVLPQTAGTPAAIEKQATPDISPQQSSPPSNIPGNSSQTASNQSAPAGQNSDQLQGSSVRIALIHYRGTLERLGCCVPGLYEEDEFVAIQNYGNTPQDISGWVLKNETRGYPSFTFPSYFPCVPFIPGKDFTYVSNAPQTVSYQYANLPATRTNATSTSVDWTTCSPLAPVDETPMKPFPGQGGKPIPCILYPGQTVLVFTDEMHCVYGGFSFNYGPGNIWDNKNPDTAVLYNARGEEVSRRSYNITP